MKTMLCALASAGVLSVAGLAIASPAAAQGYHYRTSEADYRAYCRDEGYYDRYEWYCRRFNGDDNNENDYDDGGYGDSSSYDIDDDTYDDVQSRVRNSNYNHNRTYMPGYDPTDTYRTDGGDDDRYDAYDYGADYPSQTAVPGRTQGNTGGYGQGNDSNSYTGQRSTTH